MCDNPCKVRLQHAHTMGSEQRRADLHCSVAAAAAAAARWRHADCAEWIAALGSCPRGDTIAVAEQWLTFVSLSLPLLLLALQVSELKISKTGKHGSSKANMVGYDLITNRKYQEVRSTNNTRRRDSALCLGVAAGCVALGLFAHDILFLSFSHSFFFRLSPVTPPCSASSPRRWSTRCATSAVDRSRP